MVLKQRQTDSHLSLCPPQRPALIRLSCLRRSQLRHERRLRVHRGLPLRREGRDLRQRERETWGEIKRAVGKGDVGVK